MYLDIDGIGNDIAPDQRGEHIVSNLHIVCHQTVLYQPSEAPDDRCSLHCSYGMNEQRLVAAELQMLVNSSPSYPIQHRSRRASILM
jgi:hypothetical protein